MRKVFERIKATLKQFLKQRDNLLLLVPCEDSDVPLLLHALRELDRESGSDLVLLFAREFKTPEQFLERVDQTLYSDKRAGKIRPQDQPALP